MFSGVSETAKNITGTVVSTTTKVIVDNIKNVRIDDLTKIFMHDPRVTNNQVHNNSNDLDDLVNDSITPEMINIDELSIDCKNKDKTHIKCNDEYLLSIHSANTRSRNRSQICDPNDIVTLDHYIIDSIKSNLCLDKKAISVFNDIINKNKLSIDSISFSGGGYNCMYHLGVVRYIFENPELFKDTKYCGASGGSGIVALVLCFENDPDKFKVIQEILDFVIGLRSKNLKLNKQVNEYSKKLFQFMSEDKFNQHILNSDRCHISVTNVTYIIPRNEIKTKFTSYTQFMDTLKASACIPIVLDDKIRTIDGKSYLDGGLSNNLPTIDENTLKISCLNYPLLNAHLYPKYVCDILCCFSPPDKNYIMNMHDQGYNDIEQYMKERYNKLQIVKNDQELNECVDTLMQDSVFNT